MLNHKLSKNVYVEKKLLGGLVDHNFADKFYRINTYIYSDDDGLQNADYLKLVTVFRGIRTCRMV